MLWTVRPCLCWCPSRFCCCGSKYSTLLGETASWHSFSAVTAITPHESSRRLLVGTLIAGIDFLAFHAMNADMIGRPTHANRAHAKQAHAKNAHASTHCLVLLPSPQCVLPACRVLQPTKNPFMDTLKAVIQDVKWFLFLLVLTVWGFTCAFYILFRQDQQYEVCSSGKSSLLYLWYLAAWATSLPCMGKTRCVILSFEDCIWSGCKMELPMFLCLCLCTYCTLPPACLTATTGAWSC